MLKSKLVEKSYVLYYNKIYKLCLGNKDTTGYSIGDRLHLYI